MVIDQTNGLHMGIHDRAADEFETALLQVLAQRVGGGGRGRKIFQLAPPILDRSPLDELPDVIVETPERFLDR